MEGPENHNNNKKRLKKLMLQNGIVAEKLHANSEVSQPEGPEEGQRRGLLGVLLLGTAGEVDKATMHSRVGSGDRRRVT